MSPEKRLLPFLEAVAASDVDAEVEIVGGGAERRAAERIAARAGRPRIRFAGRIAYADVLARIAAADAVVQTSIGFETQGMTPFEAATLGTPTIVSDPDIAAELCGGLWAVPERCARRARPGSPHSPRRCASPPPTSWPAARRSRIRRSPPISGSPRGPPP